MLEINAKLEISPILNAEIDKDLTIPSEFESNFVASDDYEKLKHKPKLNGKVIIGEMEEEDPTVPEWAKEENKPKYDVTEIDNAVDENNAISIETLASLFDDL